MNKRKRLLNRWGKLQNMNSSVDNFRCKIFYFGLKIYLIIITSFVSCKSNITSSLLITTKIDIKRLYAELAISMQV